MGREFDGGGTVSPVDAERVAAVRCQMVPHSVFVALAETFQAMGDPTRVKLLFALSRAELCVCDLATLLGVSVSAVSHQLRVLRSLRLVRSRREGRRVYYTLDDDHIRTLFLQGLAHVEHRRALPGNGKGWKGGNEELAAAGAAARR